MHVEHRTLEEILQSPEPLGRHACGHPVVRDFILLKDAPQWRKVMCRTCNAAINARFHDRGWRVFYGNVYSEAKAILVRAMVWIAFEQYRQAILPLWGNKDNPDLFGDLEVPPQVIYVLSEIEGYFQEWTADRWAHLNTLSLPGWFEGALRKTSPPITHRDWNAFSREYKQMRQTVELPEGQPSPFFGLHAPAWAAYFGKTARAQL